MIKLATFILLVFPESSYLSLLELTKEGRGTPGIL